MYRILIISDDVFLRNLVCQSLGGLQAELHGAESAAQIESMCGRMLFDLVIVLQASPFVAGHEVIPVVRPPGLRKPLFYVISWQQAEQTVLSLLESGVDQYMTFPISLHRLRGKVADELTRQL